MKQPTRFPKKLILTSSFYVILDVEVAKLFFRVWGTKMQQACMSKFFRPISQDSKKEYFDTVFGWELLQIHVFLTVLLEEKDNAERTKRFREEEERELEDLKGLIDRDEEKRLKKEEKNQKEKEKEKGT